MVARSSRQRPPWLAVVEEIGLAALRRWRVGESSQLSRCVSRVVVKSWWYWKMPPWPASG